MSNILLPFPNSNGLNSREHNALAEGNCKKKEDCLECKPLFHFNTFLCSIKCKEENVPLNAREAWLQ